MLEQIFEETDINYWIEEKHTNNNNNEVDRSMISVD